MSGKTKVAIIGAGPVGGIMGAYLTRAGHNVVFCDVLKGHLDAIHDKGLTVTGVTEMNVRIENLACGIPELALYPDVDTIVISTKASIMPRFIPDIQRVAQPGTKFISAQNGLGNEEYLAGIFGQDRVLRMVINYGGGQTGDGQLWMSFFNPPNYIGALAPEGEPAACQMADMLTAAGLTTQFAPDIQRYVWEKVILNIALNPVCALTQKPMKDMIDCPDTRVLAEELMREGIEVARASGVGFDEGFFEFCVGYLKKAGYHRTSMQQDILRKVPTEIDWLCGKIAERGRALGVKTPYNFAITALIKGVEMKSGAPEQH